MPARRKITTQRSPQTWDDDDGDNHGDDDPRGDIKAACAHESKQSRLGYNA